MQIALLLIGKLLSETEGTQEGVSLLTAVETTINNHYLKEIRT
jgi:hypothetical protein